MRCWPKAAGIPLCPPSTRLAHQGRPSRALYLTKLHQRLLSPTLDGLDLALRPALVASPHRLDRALVDLNVSFDRLAEMSGLRLAA